MMGRHVPKNSTRNHKSNRNNKNLQIKREEKVPRRIDKEIASLRFITRRVQNTRD